MGKVTGIGGVFFKCKNPEEVKKWYSEKLGLVTNEYGSMFEFRLAEDPDKKGYLQWSAFKQDSNYFAPSDKEFMINYRVDNLVELIKELRVAGVEIVDDLEEFEYGKFIHILDPEGNKIELWEPVDEAFDEVSPDE